MFHLCGKSIGVYPAILPSHSGHAACGTSARNLSKYRQICECSPNELFLRCKGRHACRVQVCPKPATAGGPPGVRSSLLTKSRSKQTRNSPSSRQSKVHAHKLNRRPQAHTKCRLFLQHTESPHSSDSYSVDDYTCLNALACGLPGCSICSCVVRLFSWHVCGLLDQGSRGLAH